MDPLPITNFISPEQSTHIRSLTGLLRILEVTQSREQRKGSAFVKLEKNDQGRIAEHYEYLSSLCNILVRESSEVLAIIPGKRLSEAAGVLVFATRSPQSSEHSVKRNQANLPKVKVAFSETARSSLLDSEANTLIQFAISRWITDAESLTLAEHCALVAGLLRRCHEADLSKSDTSTAIKNLMQYVLVASFTAIYNDRMKPGWSRHTFWEELVEKLDVTLEGEVLLDSQMQSDLSETGPNEHQRRFLVELATQGHFEESEIDLPVFNALGRRRILHICRRVLQHNREAFESLKQLCQDLGKECLGQTQTPSAQYKKERKEGDSREERDADIGAIIKAALTTAINSQEFQAHLDSILKAQRQLDYLVSCFGLQIKMAVAWLANSRGLKRTTKQERFQGMNPNQEIDSSSDPPTSQVSSSSAPSSSLPQPESNTSQAVHENLRDLDLKTPNDEDDELDDLVESDKHTYGAAFLKWMELVALHHSSMVNLIQVPKDLKDIKLFLRTLKTRNIEATPEFRDLQQDSFTATLASLIANYDDAEALGNPHRARGWFLAQMEQQDATTAMGMTNNFVGTMHCETVLLTLHELAVKLKAPKRSDEEIRAALSEMSIRCDIEPEVLRQLAGTRDIIAISKPCCPACNVVVKHAQKKIRKEERGSYILARGGKKKRDTYSAKPLCQVE